MRRRRRNEEPGIRCNIPMPEGPRPFDPNSLSNKEYFEWLNNQPLSKREYYKLYFARLKRKNTNTKDFKNFINGRK